MNQSRMKSSKFIALSAIIVALTFVMGLFPFVFLVPLLISCNLQDSRFAVVGTLSFSLVSVIYSYLTPSLVSVVFVQYPLIAVLPRLLVGVIAYGSQRLINFMLKPVTRKAQYASSLIVSLIGSIANTVLVVGAMILFASQLLGASVYVFVIALVPQIIFEIIAVAVVVPPLSIALNKVTNQLSMN